MANVMDNLIDALIAEIVNLRVALKVQSVGLENCPYVESPDLKDAICECSTTSCETCKTDWEGKLRDDIEDQVLDEYKDRLELHNSLYIMKNDNNVDNVTTSDVLSDVKYICEILIKSIGYTGMIQIPLGHDVQLKEILKRWEDNECQH